MGIKTWSALVSGKYKGKTAPEILVNDPAWFCTQLRNHRMTISDRELLEIGWKATCIHIPKPDRENWKIGWTISSEKEIVDFHVVKTKDLEARKYAQRLLRLGYPDPEFTFISDHVNFSYLLFLEDFRDKINWKAFKQFSDAFRRNYFGGEATKERCESFFSNDDNFILTDATKFVFMLGLKKRLYHERIGPGTRARIVSWCKSYPER
jgi:hypothetical protein